MYIFSNPKIQAFFLVKKTELQIISIKKLSSFTKLGQKRVEKRGQEPLL